MVDGEGEDGRDKGSASSRTTGKETLYVYGGPSHSLSRRGGTPSTPSFCCGTHLTDETRNETEESDRVGSVCSVPSEDVWDTSSPMKVKLFRKLLKGHRY